MLRYTATKPTKRDWKKRDKPEPGNENLFQSDEANF